MALYKNKKKTGPFMKLMRELRRNGRQVILPVLLAFALVYIYYHMLSGERGLLVWYSLRQQVHDLQQDNTVLAEQVTFLKDKVARFKEGTADKDFIDQTVRHDLGVARPDEKIIYLSQLGIMPNVN